MWIEAWHNLCYFTFPQTFEHGWYSQRVHTCFPPNNALRTDIRHFPREPLHDKWDLSFAPQFFFLLHLIAIPRSQSPLRCFISSWTSEGRLSRIRTWHDFFFDCESSTQFRPILKTAFLNRQHFSIIIAITKFSVHLKTFLCCQQVGLCSKWRLLMNGSISWTYSTQSNPFSSSLGNPNKESINSTGAENHQYSTVASWNGEI